MLEICPSSQPVKTASAHCIRVGTCVALFTLGIDKNRLDVHCNWSDDSNSYRTYVLKGCTLTEFDKLFFYDALPTNLQAAIDLDAFSSEWRDFSDPKFSFL